MFRQNTRLLILCWAALAQLRAFKRGRERREGGKQFDMVKSWIAARVNVAAPHTDRITKMESQ